MPNYAFCVLLDQLPNLNRDGPKVQALFSAITALSEVVPGQEDVYRLIGQSTTNSRGQTEYYLCQAFIFCTVQVHATIRARLNDATYRIPCQRVYMIGNRDFATVDEFVSYAKQQIGEQGASHVWGTRSPPAITVDTVIPASPVPLANFIPIADL